MLHYQENHLFSHFPVFYFWQDLKKKVPKIATYVAENLMSFQKVSCVRLAKNSHQGNKTQTELSTHQIKCLAGQGFLFLHYPIFSTNSNVFDEDVIFITTGNIILIVSNGVPLEH